jgi:hypothetical protein
MRLFSEQNRILSAVMIFFMLSGTGSALTMTLQGNSSLDFGTMAPGDNKQLTTNPSDSYAYCNKISVVSNIDTQWNAYIKADSLLTSGTMTIPADSFQWLSTYAGFSKTGNWYAHTNGIRYKTYTGFSSGTNYLAYTSGTSDLDPAVDDNITDGTEVQFIYMLTVPTDQTAGLYTTRIVYTVTQ